MTRPAMILLAAIAAGAWGAAPPAEYDRPWTGPGQMHVIASRPDIVRALCAGAPGATFALGCAVRDARDCWIFIAGDGLRPAALAALLRHERAHCNGWPAHHPRETNP